MNVPLITALDRQSVDAALQAGWISGEGPVVEQFEAEFAIHLGVEHSAAVSSGSAALELAFGALDLEPGSEVVLPTFAIMSCLNPVIRNRLKPVFVDARPSDWNMDVSVASDRIGANTGAVLAVHTYGLAVDMAPLMETAAGSGVVVIEDAAESHGVTYHGQMTGSIGSMSVHSFYANKLVSSGEGGMVSTNSSTLNNKVRLLRNLAFRPGERFIHDELGWNFRLSSMQAALGASQLRRLSETLAHKRAIASIYREVMAELEGLSWQPESNEGSENSYWVAGAILDPDRYGQASDIAVRLAAAGIGTRRFFYPLHRQPALLRYLGSEADGAFPVAERLWREGLYFPSGAGMSLDLAEEAALRIVECLT